MNFKTQLIQNMAFILAGMCLLFGVQFMGLPVQEAPSKQDTNPETIRLEIAKQVSNSSVRIYQGGHSGTGFFVQQDSKTVLVTAAHVLTKTNKKKVSFVGRKQLENGNVERHEFSMDIRNDKGEPLWHQHPNQDVAVLRVRLPKDLVVHIFDETALQIDTDVTQVGASCFIGGFPAKLESSSQGFPVIRKASIASNSIPSDKAPTFIVDYHSFAGDSGGAVVIAEGTNAGRIAGLISGQHRQTDRTIAPYEETVRHTPMGLGIAIRTNVILEAMNALK